MSTNILHLIRQSPGKALGEIQLCLNTLLPEDSIVLMDDGCYLTSHSLCNDMLTKKAQVYMIAEHAKARAINTAKTVKLISLAEINELIFSHKSSVTWQ